MTPKENKEGIHNLLSLLPALDYHLKEAEKLRRQIGSVENKLKDLRKK